MAVNLTERAARYVARSIEQRGKGMGLRVSVKASGCSGMSYQLEFADARNVDDLEFESHGIKVYIDSKSLPYLQGIELDFVREGLNEGFRFNNPNVKGTCGCGESFSV